MRSRTFTFSVFTFVATAIVMSSVFFAEEATAVPAFARQMNVSCSTCHFQNFPALNAFGRQFRADGYTIGGKQGVIEGENLSLPETLNMSVIVKLRYADTNGNSNEGTDFGQIQWPDEAAFLVGGRVSENAGFLMELGLKGGAEVDANVDIDALDLNDDGSVSAAELQEWDGTSSGDYNAFLSAKIHFNVGKAGATNFSIIPFSTDGLGAAYGFELLNTGAQRSQRPIEHRAGFSAGQALGIASNEATGFAFVASSHNYFVNLTQYSPSFDEADAKLDSLSTYLRAAYMPQLGEWDTGFGFQFWGGETEQPGDEPPLETEGWIVDAQAQGAIGSVTLGLYASYGEVPEKTYYNAAAHDNASAFAFASKFGFTNKVSAYLGYRTRENGEASDNRSNAATIGVQYNVAQNIKLELYHVRESGSQIDARSSDRDALTMFMLFAAF